ncbi:MAG: recombinase family protein [Patescibacteria group bacterium]|nr:recombinase family protein [Patescibacteria group bacterium]
MKNETNKITYFLYARKSSESEDRQVQSIEDQISRLKDLANNLNISIKEILTEAKTAKKPYCRPVFTNMLERIEKGEAQGILCWQINRLSRNPIDSGTLSWMLQQGALKCIQSIDRQYLPDDNVLLFNVESGMANQFIIDLRKNSKRGMEGKADRGWLPSRAPLGYLNDKLEHTIIEDKERFHLVRKMWNIMLTGNYTPPQIREIANKEWGFRTPKTKRDGGVEIASSVIYKLFTNIFYTGMFMWAGRVYKGNHKSMITLEEYDRVQIILGRNGKPRAQTHNFAYTGLMRCKICNSMYTASEKTKIIKSTGKLKTYVYYNCTRKKKEVKCDQKNPMTLKELEDQIDIELERYTIMPKFQEWALEILNRNNDKEIEERTKIYENQHRTLVNTQKELDTLTKMRYRELIDDETFIKERDELTTKIVKLKTNLRETESRAEKWLELTEKTFNFSCYARKEFLLGDLNKKREIFSALGQNFLVKDKKIHITPNEWFVPIEKAYPELEKKYKRLELDKNLTVEARNMAFAQLILEWGDYRDLNPN